MEGDTWGISGPDFLGVFIFMAVVALAVAIAARQAVLRGGPSDGFATLDAQRAAYLNGGPQLAIYASLGFLRQAGAIGAGPGRMLVTTGPLPAGATPLDRAIHLAAARKISARGLRHVSGVERALATLRQSLEDAGLAATPAMRSRARLAGVLPLAAVEALGIVRIVAGVANGKPVGFLILATLAVSVALVVMLVVRVPLASAAGRRAIARLRRDNAHLAPSQSPAYATYGAAAAAMGVAVFGSAALFAADPAFAEEAELQRNVAASGASSGGGSGDGGSSSSCGGSSCGGGGGCGGGCGG